MIHIDILKMSCFASDPLQTHFRLTSDSLQTDFRPTSDDGHFSKEFLFNEKIILFNKLCIMTFQSEVNLK